MADTTNMIDPDDDPKQVSFEAADAVPGVEDDLEDQTGGRHAIDLDAPIDLGAALADFDRPARPVSATPVPVDGDGAAPAADPAPAANQLSPAANAKELEEARAQAADANDKYLRALADLQNFRRRNEEDIQRRVREGNERLIKELLPVLDDFDLAMGAAQQAQSYDQLIGGVEAILRKFRETLAKQGVQPIPAVGEKFDTDVHEAVMLDEDSDLPDETVSAELRKGYTMHGHVIRPALVKVAKSA